MNEMQKQMIKQLGLSTDEFEPNNSDDKTRISDLEDAISVLAEMIVGGASDD